MHLWTGISWSSNAWLVACGSTTLLSAVYVEKLHNQVTKTGEAQYFKSVYDFVLGHIRAILGCLGKCILRLQVKHAFEKLRGCWVPVGCPKDSDSSLRGLEFAFLTSLRLLLSGYFITETGKVTITDPLAADGGIQLGQLPVPVEILMQGGGSERRGVSDGQLNPKQPQEIGFVYVTQVTAHPSPGGWAVGEGLD